jgi:uncharacterized membrane protein
VLHLIHPALVHFSVAFLVVGAASEAVGLLARLDAAARWGGTLVLVGAASLVPTIVSGYLAANTLAFDAAAEPLLDAHERNGWILLGLVLAVLFWKAWNGGRVADGQRLVYALLLGAVLAVALWSAWLGGRMVYFEGVGVLR